MPLFVLLAAIAATSPAGGSPAHVPSLITFDGVGGVRPGMTVGQVEHRFGVQLRLDDLGTECKPAFFRSGAVEG